MRDEIVRGFADALFAFAYVDAIEDEDCPHAVPWPRGAAIDPYLPQTPEIVRRYAMVCLYDIERRNEREVVEAYAANCRMRGHRTEPTPYKFGWHLATAWMGHGVSWEDNHPPHFLEIMLGDHFSIVISYEDPLEIFVDASYLYEGVRCQPK